VRYPAGFATVLTQTGESGERSMNAVVSRLITSAEGSAVMAPPYASCTTTRTKQIATRSQNNAPLEFRGLITINGGNDANNGWRPDGRADELLSMIVALGAVVVVSYGTGCSPADRG
jgi:hypothetical protein